MTWNLKISRQAEKDLSWFRKNEKPLYIKCFDLTLAVLENPYTGIGKPEHLKRLGGNVWSRRVNLEHRMVYEIYENKQIIVIAYRYHYRW